MLNEAYQNYKSSLTNTISNITSMGKNSINEIVSLGDSMNTEILRAAIEMPRKQFNRIYKMPHLEPVRKGINEVDQQIRWAYNYWEVEDNIPKHLDAAGKMTMEVLHDELRQYI